MIFPSRYIYNKVFTAGYRSYFRLTTAQKEAFDRDGFFIARGLLSKDELNLVKSVIETDESLNENEIRLNDEAGGKTNLALWSNPGNGTLGFLTRSQRVVTTVERLLGGPIMHYHSKTLIKNANEGGVWNWHQDYGYWYKDYFETPQMLTAYFAIDAQDEGNGCLKVLRGSHVLGRQDHWTIGDQQGCDEERVEQARKRYEEVNCVMSGGDCCFFHALTLHSSQGNHSNRRRIAYASAFTLKSNTQYKEPYIPCWEIEPVADEKLLEVGFKHSMAKEKVMLTPDVGKDAARKDSADYAQTAINRLNDDKN